MHYSHGCYGKELVYGQLSLQKKKKKNNQNALALTQDNHACL